MIKPSILVTPLDVRLNEYYKFNNKRVESENKNEREITKYILTKIY